MKEQLEKINDSIKPYYALISMIIFFGGLFLTAYKYVISPSDLRINVETESLHYPTSIANSYTNLFNYVLSKDTLLTDAQTIYSFIVKTTESKRITLKNSSSKTLRGVKFRHLNTDDLTAWAISSDYLTANEEQKLKENLEFDEARKMIHLLYPIDIAPKSQISIVVWGSFKEDIFDHDIIASYDDGEGHIERTYNIGGMKGYLVNYAFEFIVLMLLIFIAVYYIGIKFVKEEK
jgi:hypothetical protein